MSLALALSLFSLALSLAAFWYARATLRSLQETQRRLVGQPLFKGQIGRYDGVSHAEVEALSRQATKILDQWSRTR